MLLVGTTLLPVTRSRVDVIAPVFATYNHWVASFESLEGESVFFSSCLSVCVYASLSLSCISGHLWV